MYDDSLSHVLNEYASCIHLRQDAKLPPASLATTTMIISGHPLQSLPPSYDPEKTRTRLIISPLLQELLDFTASVDAQVARQGDTTVIEYLMAELLALHPMCLDMGIAEWMYPDQLLLV